MKKRHPILRSRSTLLLHHHSPDTARHLVGQDNGVSILALRATTRPSQLSSIKPLLADDPSDPAHRSEALRQEVWRLMHTPLATQHEWLAAVLREHYGYYGRPHNYPALNGFYRKVRRTWLCCLRRRSQTNRRMGWEELDTLTARLRLPTPRILRTGAQARI